MVELVVTSREYVRIGYIIQFSDAESPLDTAMLNHQAFCSFYIILDSPVTSFSAPLSFLVPLTVWAR